MKLWLNWQSVSMLLWYHIFLLYLFPGVFLCRIWLTNPPSISELFLVNKKAVYKLWCQYILCLTTKKKLKSCGVNALCVWQQESCLQVVVSMHHMFVNKKAVYKLWCQCIMCLSTRKLFTSCGINASYVCQQKSCLKVVVSMHRVFHNKKFKSCGVNASCLWCLWQQERILKVVVSMHYVYVNKKAV